MLSCGPHVVGYRIRNYFALLCYCVGCEDGVRDEALISSAGAWDDGRTGRGGSPLGARSRLPEGQTHTAAGRLRGQGPAPNAEGGRCRTQMPS